MSGAPPHAGVSGADPHAGASGAPPHAGASGASDAPAPGEDAARRVPPHIVDAARHVLARDGLAAATLERISAAAGISRMTLHRRGVSKNDILGAIAAGLEADYREAMWPALVSTGSGRERFAAALDRLCDVTERNLALLGALSAASRDSIYHESRSGALTRKVFVQPLERLLLDGAADGTLAALDAEEAATVVFNVIGHTYTHLRLGHGWSPERARAGVLALVMDGVVARTGVIARTV